MCSFRRDEKPLISNSVLINIELGDPLSDDMCMHCDQHLLSSVMLSVSLLSKRLWLFNHGFNPGQA